MRFMYLYLNLKVDFCHNLTTSVSFLVECFTKFKLSVCNAYLVSPHQLISLYYVLVLGVTN